MSEGGFIVGDRYTISDIATRKRAARHSIQGIDLNDFPNVLAWYLEIAARPAVRAGWAVPIPEEVPMPRGFDDD